MAWTTSSCGQRALVDPRARQRVVDVDERDHPPGDRDGLAPQALGVAGAVPPLVVRVDDLLRELQEEVVAHADPLLGARDHVAPVDRMPRHLLPLVVGEWAGLPERPVRDPDLADVVDRRQPRDQIDVSGVRKLPEPRVRRERLAERSRVAAAPDEVRAGLEVPRLGERGEGVEDHLARRPELAVALVGARALGDQPVERGEAQGAGERERREQGRDVPAAGAEQPPGAEPEQERCRRARAAAPTATRARGREGHPDRGDEDERELGDGPARRAPDEVALQEVVHHRRVDLGAGEERAERRRHHVAEPEGGHAHEHDPARGARRQPPAPGARRSPRPAGTSPRGRGSARARSRRRRAGSRGRRARGPATPRWDRRGRADRRPGPRGPWRARGSGRSRRRARRSAASAGESRRRPATRS